jgi:hypothetical protein
VEYQPVAALDTLRRVTLGLFVLGSLGAGVELLLLGHIEGFSQQAPLFVIAASLIVVVWHAVTRGARSVRVFQAIMVLFIVTGLIGVGLHYDANAEFERELSPSIQGLALFREAISGATPALAPGLMVQLGLLGLAYTYRHPALGLAMHGEATTRRQ